MENLQNNISNKIDSQDNQLEKSEGKRIKTIEIKVGKNTYSLETESYDFEYPKNIQEKTGIVGYERTKINKDNLLILIKEYAKNQYDLIIEDKDIFLEDEQKDSTDEVSDFYYENEKLRINKNLRGISKEICHNLILSLSNGEYPNQTFTHKMGAYHYNLRDEYSDKFVKDNFFLQKIYDLDNIKDQVEENQETSPYSSSQNDVPLEQQVNMTVFNKKTGQKVHEEDYLSMNEVSKYYKGIKSGDLFVSTPCAGLNVATGHFFDNQNDLTNASPSFGFSIKDPFFKKYLDRSLDIYTKQVKNFNFNNVKKGQYPMQGSGISAILQMLILEDEDMEKMVFSDGQTISQFFNRLTPSSTMEYALLGKKIIEKIESEHDIKIEDFLSFNDYKKGEEIKDQFIKSFDFGADVELHLPVFIGNENIPQLSWGHATYGNFTNSKGFNFFKFKHHKNLPIQDL